MIMTVNSRRITLTTAILIAALAAARGDDAPSETALLLAPFDAPDAWQASIPDDGSVSVTHTNETPHSGPHALRVRFEARPEAGDEAVSRAMVAMPRALPAAVRELELHIRGNVPGARLVPLVSGLDDGLRKQVRLTPIALDDTADWTAKRSDMSPLRDAVRGPWRFEGFIVEAPAGASGSLDVDTLRALVPGAPVRPWRVAVFSGYPDNAVTAPPEDGVVLFALVQNLADTAQELDLHWDVRQRDRSVVAEGRTPGIRLAPGAHRVERIVFEPGAHTGPYTFSAGATEPGRDSTTRQAVYASGDDAHEFTTRVTRDNANWVRLRRAYVEDDGQPMLAIRYEMDHAPGQTRMDYFDMELPEAMLRDGRRLQRIALRLRNRDLGDGRGNDTRVQLMLEDADGRERTLGDREGQEMWISGTRDWQTVGWELDGWDEAGLSFPLRRAYVRFWKTHGTNWGMRRGDAAGLLLLQHVEISVDDRAALRFSVANGRALIAGFAGQRVGEYRGLTVRPVSDAGYGDSDSLRLELAGFRGRQAIPQTYRIPGAPIRMTMMVKSEVDGVALAPSIQAPDQGRVDLSAKPVAADGEWTRLAWTLPGAGQGAMRTAWPHILRYPLELEQVVLHAGDAVDGTVWIDDIAFDSQLEPDEMTGIEIDVDVAYQDGQFRPTLDARVRSNARVPVTLPVICHVMDAGDETIFQRRVSLDIEPGRSAALDLREVDFQTTSGPHRIVVEIPASHDTDEPTRVSATVVVPNAAFVVEDFEHVRGALRAQVSEAAARNGTYGLRWIYHADDFAADRERPLPVELPGRARMVGLWVKGDGGGLALRLHGHGYKQNERIQSHAVTVDWDGWRFVTFTLPRVAPGDYRVDVRRRPSHPYTLTHIELSGAPERDGELHLDDLTVCTALPPEKLVHLAALPRETPDSLAAPGWQPTLRLQNRSLSDPFRGGFDYRVVTGTAADTAADWAGARTVGEDAEVVDLAAGHHAYRTLAWEAREAGPFHIRGALVSEDGGPRATLDEEVLVLDMADKRWTELRDALRDALQLRQLGGVKTELFEVDWNELEPRPGRTDYGPFDRRFSQLAGTDAELVGRLGFSTYWNAPGGYWMDTAGQWTGDASGYPLDLRLWYEYCHETARRYPLDYWEIWPYPDRAVDAADISLERYLRLLTIARVAIQQATPESRIVLGTLTAEGMGEYLRRFLEQGGDLVDVVMLDPIDTLLAPEIAFLQERVGEVVRAVDLVGADKQVWVGELNWSTADPANPQAGVPESVQAAFLVRGKTQSLAAGADRVFVRFDSGEGDVRASPGIAYRREGENWTLKPGFAALQVFDMYLGAADFVAEVFLPDRAFHWAYAYMFETDDDIRVAMWRRVGRSELTLPDGLTPQKASDLYGNRLDLEAGAVTLSPMPVYVSFPRDQRDALPNLLPLATMAYADHADSRWKQNLLDAFNTAAGETGGRDYDAGQRTPVETVAGIYRDRATLAVASAAVSGEESFMVDLSGLEAGQDLLIQRRLDLEQVGAGFVVDIAGREIARYDLAALAPLINADEKRFHDLTIPVPAARLGDAARKRVRVRFKALDDGTFQTGITRFYGKPPGPLFLSDIDYWAGRQSTMAPRMDENMRGTPLHVGGQLVEKGLCTHARAHLVYPLGGHFRRFHFTPVLEDSPGEAGSVQFQVVVDGQLVYESPETVTQYTAVEPVTLAIDGAQVLELRLEDGGDGIEGDWGVWANAYLETGSEDMD